MKQKEFKVSFGAKGRTLVYEDAGGIISFAFDCSPAEKNSGTQWNLRLGKIPLVDVDKKLILDEDKTESEELRIETALERVEQYASSCGYISPY